MDIIPAQLIIKHSEIFLKNKEKYYHCKRELIIKIFNEKLKGDHYNFKINLPHRKEKEPRPKPIQQSDFWQIRNMVNRVRGPSK